MSKWTILACRMCIVIDANAFPSVFNKAAKNHRHFLPVKKWIMDGKGRVVYGGTKYRNELKQMSKYWPVLLELKNQGKVDEVQSRIVDHDESIVKQLIPDSKFDDSHIVAIIRVSNCRLLCSQDKRSDKYLTQKKLYRKRQKPPSIYRSKAHVHLLCDRNIVKICNKV